MSGTTFDRREFIVGAGALAIASALPVAFAAAEPAVGDATPRAKLSDWHVDDMWGVYPRPSEAIGYGRPLVRVRLRGRGRTQHHVVEWREQHAAVQKVQVQGMFELRPGRAL